MLIRFAILKNGLYIAKIRWAFVPVGSTFFHRNFACFSILEKLPVSFIPIRVKEAILDFKSAEMESCSNHWLGDICYILKVGSVSVCIECAEEDTVVAE